MAGKSISDRMATTEERIRQLEARKRQLAQQLREQDRKRRTRRLIQIGAIMNRLGIDTVERAQLFQQAVERSPQVRAWLAQLLSSVRDAPGGKRESSGPG